MLNVANVLLPTDFSACSYTALRWARTLAKQFGAQIVALHVWEPPRYVIPEVAIHVPGEPHQSLVEFAQAEATKEMDAFLSPRSTEELPIRARLESGDPTDTIIETAAREHFDLIVMGTHGRTGLSHLLLGSVAESVVRRAPCPVMTIRQCDQPM